MKLQMKFFFAPRPRLNIAEITAITRQRGTFGLDGRSRDWWVRKCEEGAFEKFAPAGLPATLEPDRGEGEACWWIYADCFLPWLAEQEGYDPKRVDVNKILGIEAMAA